MADSELREVYSAADTQDAHFIKAALEDAGIDARVVGDHLQNAVGDLPFVAIAPRVWVRSDDFEKARAIIAAHQQVKRVASARQKDVDQGLAVGTRQQAVSGRLVHQLQVEQRGHQRRGSDGRAAGFTQQLPSRQLSVHTAGPIHFRVAPSGLIMAR